MRTKNKARKPKTEQPKAVKKKPLVEENTNAVRTLIYNGAFFRYRATDEEYGEILEKGKLGKDFTIKRRGLVSNPVVIGKVEFQGMKDIEIELEIEGIMSSKPAHVTLEEAGVPEEIIDKVMKIEFALRKGAHELVDEFIGNEFDGFMGSIEGALAKSGKKEK